MRREVRVVLSLVVASILVGSTAIAASATWGVSVSAAGNTHETLFQSPPPTPRPTHVPPPPPPPGCARYHLVRAGETLYSIARLYGVSVWSIVNANRLPNPSRIYVGQWLCIPRGGWPPPPPPPPPPACGRYHCVVRGETLYSIGRLYGVSPWVIAAANGIYNLSRIYVGQRLFIPCHP